MARYSYSGVDGDGRLVEGYLDAENTGEVLDFLIKKNSQSVEVGLPTLVKAGSPTSKILPHKLLLVIFKK